jgi:hypothetical protein
MSKTFEDIPEENLDELQQKLQSLKFSIGLGNYAYTPTSEELTSWSCSNKDEIEATLQELIEKHCDDWFLKEVCSRISNEDWNKLLFDADIPQEQYEVFFLKQTTLSSNIKKVSDQILKIVRAINE